MKRKLLIVFLSILIVVPAAAQSRPRQMERLSRGVVAVNQGGKVFVGWRMFGTDADNISFNLYRTTDGKSTKLNDKPITDVTFFVDEKADLTKSEFLFRPSGRK